MINSSKVHLYKVHIKKKYIKMYLYVGNELNYLIINSVYTFNIYNIYNLIYFININRKFNK